MNPVASINIREKCKSSVRMKLIFAFLLVGVYGAVDDSYYREHTYWIDKNKKDGWMGALSDDFRFWDLTLYGTHNSVAVSNLIPFVVCQTQGLTSQLDYGIRLFDIRVRRTGNTWALHHGPVWLGKYLDEALLEIGLWMKTHPSEMIVMSVSEDDDKMKPSSESDEDVFERLLDANIRNKYGIETYQEVPGPDAKLRNYRGKLVIVGHRNGDTFSRFPLGTCSQHMWWELENIWQLQEKWNDVKEGLMRATTYKDVCVVTGLVGNNPLKLVHPAFVASGKIWPFNTWLSRLWTGHLSWFADYSYMPDFPRGICVFGFCTVMFEGMNRMTTNLIKEDNCKSKRFGFILGDFPGYELVDTIHSVNFCTKVQQKPWRPVLKPSVFQRVETLSTSFSSVDYDDMSEANITVRLANLYTKDEPTEEYITNSKYAGLNTTSQIQSKLNQYSRTFAAAKTQYVETTEFEINVLDGTELERAQTHNETGEIKVRDFGVGPFDNAYSPDIFD